ncbi:hypothetical protein RhiirA1_454041 [Rhizophagus irregularis]|uniref:Uncharacterized protein n=1 Tax=Rhizophagus irregularis TaxID=588596 RepID=A0A2N0S630_9GLOM|nr:hypothetical protein RhiirA1_454041 [Rhizophagus irregularis]
MYTVKRNKTRGTSRLSEEDSRTFGEKYNDNTTRCGLSPVNGEHHIGSDAMGIECGECFSRRTIKGIQTQFGQLSRICSLGGDMWYPQPFEELAILFVHSFSTPKYENQEMSTKELLRSYCYGWVFMWDDKSPMLWPIGNSPEDVPKQSVKGKIMLGWLLKNGVVCECIRNH